VATRPNESISISSGYRRLVIALLRQPRWLGLAALTVGMCVLFWWLGTWQWGRHIERSERNAAINQALESAPAPLPSVVTDPDSTPLTAVYRSVTTSGSYLADQQVLQRNPRGRSGFAVVTPLALDSGGTLVVDRGWVAASPTDPNTPAVDVTPPAGSVTVTVRLRDPQPSSGRQAPEGQIYDIDPQSLEPGLPSPVYALYGELVEQSPPPDTALELPEASDTGIGVHLFYALQWWLFIGIAVVGFVMLLRRESSAAPGEDDTRGDGRAEEAGQTRHLN
jgi:cytochrome oxidase assembly protein ShyY1